LHNIADYSLTELSHRIGIVTQDPQLFSGSIKDNLIFVKPGATDEDCMKVLEQAQLTEFITSQPD
jgi:ATP-binding cassette subfamily B protein